MGIVDETLAEFELSAFDHCEIEQDVNGSIHVHLDSIRIELSPEEFVYLVELLEDAQQTLQENKGRCNSRRSTNGW